MYKINNCQIKTTIKPTIKRVLHKIKALENCDFVGYIIRAYAGIAQLVEHLIRNEGVAGSNPVSGTINKIPAFAGVFFNFFVWFYIHSIWHRRAIYTHDMSKMVFGINR